MVVDMGSHIFTIPHSTIVQYDSYPAYNPRIRDGAHRVSFRDGPCGESCRVAPEWPRGASELSASPVPSRVVCLEKLQRVPLTHMSFNVTCPRACLLGLRVPLNENVPEV